MIENQATPAELAQRLAGLATLLAFNSPLTLETRAAAIANVNQAREALAGGVVLAPDTDLRISRLVRDERERQDLRWGDPKDLPNGTGPDSRPLAFLERTDGDIASPAVELQAFAKEHTDNAMHRGRVTYADILTEEHLEALAEDDPEKLFDELIQVAAVAQKWCRALIEHQGVQR